MRKGSKAMGRMGAFALAAALAASPLAAHGRANYTKPAGVDFSREKYADGVYEGSATGFQAGLRVRVTVKGGKVTAVQVTEHNEVNSRFYSYPIKVIPAAIVKAQSTEVDAVSGATATSCGILSAVEDALAKASS